MKIILNKLYKSVLLFVIMLFVLSCANQDGQQQIRADIRNIENKYFALDFEKNDLKMSDLETYFFTNFPHDDPTEGNVIYDNSRWTNNDVIQLKPNDGVHLYIKGRDDNKAFDSFRLTSKTFYNLNKDNQKILFVFKGNLPSAKGIWPAWWLNGSRQDQWIYKDLGYVDSDSGLQRYSGKGHFYDTPSAVNATDWPGAGEIDIIENINGENIIHNTIHTCPQMCDSEWNNDGKIINCANAKPNDSNPGCSGKPYVVDAPEGTFACLWTKNNIKFYYWKPDEEVRVDGGPLSDNPDPDMWKTENLKNEVRLLESDAECTPMHQDWQCENCKSSNLCVFVNMKVIFNATLCGVWAGNKFDDTANSLSNCNEYIFGEGKEIINNKFMKIEYISVSKI